MARRDLWEQVDGDLYQILGVSSEASDDVIQEAWRSAAKRTHPDRGGSVEEFQATEIAYQVLSDPLSRRRYDRLHGYAEPTRYAWPTVADAGPAAGARSRPTTGYADTASTAGTFDWAAFMAAQGTGQEPGYVPQYEYDYRNPGPVTKLSPWVVALIVVCLIALAVVALVFMAAFSLLLILAGVVTVIGRLLKSPSKRT